MKHRSDCLVPDSCKIRKLAICGAISAQGIVKHGGIYHNHSHRRLYVFNHHCVAAKRQERRYCCSLWRHGEPDRFRTTWRGHGSFQGDHLVSHHFYGDLDHALGLRFTPSRNELGAARGEGFAGQIATGKTSDAACYASSASSATIGSRWSAFDSLQPES